jgi:hypothetical protein
MTASLPFKIWYSKPYEHRSLMLTAPVSSSVAEFIFKCLDGNLRVNAMYLPRILPSGCFSFRVSKHLLRGKGISSDVWMQETESWLMKLNAPWKMWIRGEEERRDNTLLIWLLTSNTILHPEVVHILGWGETEPTWYIGHYLVCSTSPRWRMVMSVKQSVEWELAGEPKY